MELPGLPQDEATQVLEMRQLRDSLLAASDWTQLPDAPVDSASWANYREQLRDFPDGWTPGPTADFPDQPDA